MSDNPSHPGPIGPDVPIGPALLVPDAQIARHARTKRSVITAPLPCHHREVVSLPNRVGITHAPTRVSCDRCCYTWSAIATPTETAGEHTVMFTLLPYLITRSRTLRPGEKL